MYSWLEKMAARVPIYKEMVLYLQFGLAIVLRFN
jgi:hypothetical protein